MNKDDFKDPKKRAEYFQPNEGRPTDELIAETIRKRVRQIINQGFTGEGVFATEQLLYPLWEKLPSQHQYIGQQIPRLIIEYGLPIRWYEARGDSHVLYEIILDAV